MGLQARLFQLRTGASSAGRPCAHAARSASQAFKTELGMGRIVWAYPSLSLYHGTMVQSSTMTAYGLPPSVRSYLIRYEVPVLQ
jgi:hypothetical protein